MYFLLTGRPPFEAEDALAIAFQHMHDTPTPLAKARGKNDVPLWLVSLINKLMSKSPAERYADAEQLLAAIETATTYRPRWQQFGARDDLASTGDAS